MTHLTDQHRAYLRCPDIATAPMVDAIGAFRCRFGLSGPETGELLTQWIAEVWGDPSIVRCNRVRDV